MDVCLAMPNSKPQVMWMAKNPDGNLVSNSGAPTRKATIAWLKECFWINWTAYQKDGWRIVKVEVRETKKEK